MLSPQQIETYRRDGYLVVKFPDDTLVWFPGYKALVVAYPIRMQKGVVAGKLTHDPDGVWRITDGTIGGRVKGTDLVLGFRQLGLCEADVKSYSVMVDFVNKNLDVLADGRNDSEATCDAMSAGLAFKAQQIVAGKIFAVDPLKALTHVDGGPDAASILENNEPFWELVPLPGKIGCDPFKNGCDPIHQMRTRWAGGRG